MQLLHIADLHFGRLLYGRSLMDDQRHFVRQSLLPALDEYKPDALLIAGDLYDRQIASVDAIHLFDELIDALCERNIPAVIISGNHDSPDRIAVGKSLLARHGIHIITELKDAFTPVEIGNIQIFPLPYFENAQMRYFLGDETLRGAGACMRAAVEKMEKAFDPAKKHVLVAHCFAAGASTSDSERRLFVGGAGDVDERGQHVIVDEILGQIDAQPRSVEGHLRGALRIPGEHAAQIQIDDSVLLLFERLPLGGGGDVRHWVSPAPSMWRGLHRRGSPGALRAVRSPQQA